MGCGEVHDTGVRGSGNDSRPDDAALLASATSSVLSFNANRGGLAEQFNTYTIAFRGRVDPRYTRVLNRTPRESWVVPLGGLQRLRDLLHRDVAIVRFANERALHDCGERLG